MKLYLGIVTPDELETLRKARRPGIPHPLAALISRIEANNGDFIAINTELAARLIIEKDEAWLKALRPRLLATDDFTHASSALGEIRAYGALLESWMMVTPSPIIVGSGVSPEFKISNGDGDVIVEVHSRQLDGEQSGALDEKAIDLQKRHSQSAKNADTETASKGTITFAESEVFPTGKPNPNKEGDSVLTNTISRIACIKQSEKQIDPGKPFVLWLDLQDSGVWGTPLALELFCPLYCEGIEGKIGCGPFWFALYGRKGDPLLESNGYSYASHPMAHEGRFFQTMKSHRGPTRVSAVVYSTPTATILMENPNAHHRLPARVRAAMLKLPRFKLDISSMDWEKGLVSSLIENHRQALVAATRELRSFDAVGQ